MNPTSNTNQTRIQNESIPKEKNQQQHKFKYKHNMMYTAEQEKKNLNYVFQKYSKSHIFSSEWSMLNSIYIFQTVVLYDQLISILKQVYYVT